MTERRSRQALRAIWATGAVAAVLWAMPPRGSQEPGAVEFARALQQSAPVSEGDIHNLRGSDDLTTSTLTVAKGENALSFDDLRATKLGRRPPPVFEPRLSALDGKTVRIHGFMAPYDSLNDLRVFMLMETSVGCYFCVPPSPKEVVLVRIKTDKIQDFVEPAIEVEGTLSLWADEKAAADEAHKMFLYVINDAKITVVKETADIDRGDAY